MSTTRTRDRIFAALGAILFLGSACAVTAYYIATSHSPSTPSSQAQTCLDNQTEPTLTAPEAYQPTGQVTSLISTDLEPGSGTAAKSGDCVVVKYYGTLASNGIKFDENFTEPTAFAFTLGQGQVIAGWDQGLVGMKVGGVRRLVIPASLAYKDQSPTQAIPANSDLVFVVKLLRIQK